MELTNLMEVLVAVVEEDGFTAAGRRLNMPTPTVSRHIARLEDRLGVRLLQRTTRRVSATEAGEIYYERAKQIVGDIEELELDVRALDEVPRGRLRVSLPTPGAPVPILECLVTRYMTRYPDVLVETSFTNRLVDLIDEGYDVALRAGQLSDSSLRARKLGDSHLRLVVSPAYLEEAGTPTSTEALIKHKCLVYRADEPRSFWPLLGGGTVALRPRLMANSMTMLLEAALAGLGIALVPQSMASPALASGELVMLLPKIVGSDSGLYVVFPHNRYLSAKVRAFIDLAVDWAEDNPLF